MIPVLKLGPLNSSPSIAFIDLLPHPTSIPQSTRLRDATLGSKRRMMRAPKLEIANASDASPPPPCLRFFSNYRSLRYVQSGDSDADAPYLRRDVFPAFLLSRVLRFYDHRKFDQT